MLDGAATSELTVDILNAKGERVRHLSSTKTNKEVQPPEWPDRLVPNDLIPAHAGMNRMIWDLRWDDQRRFQALSMGIRRLAALSFRPAAIRCD